MTEESNIPTVLRRKLPPHLEKIKNGHYLPDDKDYIIQLYLKDNDLRVQEEGSDIVGFLRGKHILVTGATGFLGKLLVEKLLRCCKDIGSVYIVVRTKKGKEPESRVKEYLDSWVFYKLAEIYPNFREKVVGISGDFEEDGLGFSEDAKKLIKKKINIIYHVAATVRFDEKLTKAVNINIRGTQQLLQLAKECTQLEVFLYMSTAFSNCLYKHVDEVFYPPYVDPYKLMGVVQNLPEEVVERITPGLLGTIPNTYAFTKQIAEDLVRREGAGLPICIQRPSVVVASVREPVRSWMDNIFGPVGLMMAAAKGVIHIVYGAPGNRCDLVPADYTINNCIACSYKTGKLNENCRPKEVTIYNFTSSDDNPTIWKCLADISKAGGNLGSTQLLMKGFGRFTSSWYWYLLVSFWLHTVPAYILDGLATLMGKKAMFKPLYGKIDKAIKALAYFTLNEWTFGYRNSADLWEELNPVDKKNFYFDMKSLDWPEYFDTYLVSMREFLTREFLDNLEEGRANLKRLDIVWYLIVSVVIGSTVYFLLNTPLFFVPLMFISILLYYLLT